MVTSHSGMQVWAGAGVFGNTLRLRTKNIQVDWVFMRPPPAIGRCPNVVCGSNGDRNELSLVFQQKLETWAESIDSYFFRVKGTGRQAASVGGRYRSTLS